MTLLSTLVVCWATVSNPGPAELLVFTSDRCPACRQAEPTVDRLRAEGAPIRVVDADFDRDLVRRFNVTAIPCFVLLAGGREADRAVGPVGYARLSEMLARADRAAAPATLARSAGPSAPPGGADCGCEGGVCPLPGGPAPPARLAEDILAATTRGGLPAAALPPTGGRDVQQVALAASVRIRVDDRTGTGFGSGVIIDVRRDDRGGQEALIMTCGHLFRDFDPAKDVIEVDFPHQADNRACRAQLIRFHADQADIGLIAIRPMQPVQTAKVAGTAIRPAIGEPVFSIGCDRGAPPTVRPTRISGIDKYLGPPNIEIAGQPVQGRSGGGLFNAAGELIGICNAADPADDEGLYAALPLLHWQLAQVGQERIYRGDVPAPAAIQLAAASVPPTGPAVAPAAGEFAAGRTPRREARPELTPVSLTTPRGHDGWTGGPTGSAPEADAEVMVIIRPRDGQAARTIILDQPTPELLREIHRAQAAPVEAPSTPRTAAMPRAAYRLPPSAVEYHGQPL